MPTGGEPYETQLDYLVEVFESTRTGGTLREGQTLRNDHEDHATERRARMHLPSRRTLPLAKLDRQTADRNRRARKAYRSQSCRNLDGSLRGLVLFSATKAGAAAARLLCPGENRARRIRVSGYVTRVRRFRSKTERKA